LAPKKFIPPRLFVFLVLERVTKVDDRGIDAILRSMPAIRAGLGLKETRRLTTLQQAGASPVTAASTRRVLERSAEAGCDSEAPRGGAEAARRRDEPDTSYCVA
jgi:hypothetical protein